MINSNTRKILGLGDGEKPRLLWIGDACCDSGFAKGTHYTLDNMGHAFERFVLGVNHHGDPDKSAPYDYPIWPCWPGGDMFGIGRLEDPEFLRKMRPHVIVIQNDPWNIPTYMKVLRQTGVPVVATLAVDGLNCRGGDAKAPADDFVARGLNDLALASFWTEFGRTEAVMGGCEAPTAVVPLGVDREIYRPGSQAAARQALGLPLPSGAFLVGNVNRNQPRKRLDLTIKFFAKFAEQAPNAYLYLHVAPTGESSFDLDQLVQYYGLKGKVLKSAPYAYHGLSEETMALLYRSLDVLVTTSQGEGFGLPVLEAMACGIVPVVPAWSALKEWTEGAAIQVPCSTISTTFNGINVIGGVPDEAPFVRALDRLYRDRRERESLGRKALELASNKRFSWETIGARFAANVCEALDQWALGKDKK